MARRFPESPKRRGGQRSARTAVAASIPYVAIAHHPARAEGALAVERAVGEDLAAGVAARDRMLEAFGGGLAREEAVAPGRVLRPTLREALLEGPVEIELCRRGGRWLAGRARACRAS